MQLKFSRNLFMLIIAIVNALVAYLATILPYYLPQQISAATVIFIEAVGNAVVIYLSTEEQQAQ